MASAAEPSCRERVTRVTAAYAFGHVVVDLACVSTVLGLAAPAVGPANLQARALAVLAYDMVAFCMQLPAGALLDALGRRMSQRAALASFALVASGVSCGWAGGTAAGVASVLLLALGNALFHCVGGVEVLGESDGRAAPSGLFISTGAAGVFLGSMAWFNTWQGTPWLLLALLVASAAAALLAPRADGGPCLGIDLSPQGWAAVCLLAITVALRSYTGMVMAFPWKAELAWAVLSVCAVIAGKALGGVLSDRVGMPLASALSLGGAALLFLPAWAFAPAGLAATLLFNLTMAITLTSLADLLPRAKGTAFGIASFSLAIGSLPAFAGLRVGSALGLCVLSVASLAALELGLLIARKA